jgi:hypothetical protein
MSVLILACVGGLLTILSPCILPVLPFVFARLGQPFRSRVLPMLVGMAVSFAAVGSLAASSGYWVVQPNQTGRMVPWCCWPSSAWTCCFRPWPIGSAVGAAAHRLRARPYLCDRVSRSWRAGLRLHLWLSSAARFEDLNLALMDGQTTSALMGSRPYQGHEADNEAEALPIDGDYLPTPSVASRSHRSKLGAP